MDNNLVSCVTQVHAKADGNAWSITIPAATAGNTLVVGALGEAIITPTSQSGWTRGPAYGGGDCDLSAWYRTSTGGETTISGSQGGSGENLVIYAMELPGAFTYVDGSNNGNGITLDPDTGALVSSGTVAVTGQALVIGLFVVEQDSDFDAQSNAFFSVGPAGQMVVSAGSQDASGTAVIGAVTIADATTSDRYPHDASAGSYAATTQYLGLGPGKAFAAQAVFSNPGDPVVEFANPIERDETEPGFPLSQWYLNANSASGSIAGFPTSPSVTQGDTMTFKVDSLGDDFTAKIVRLGWYGHDSLGAKVVADLAGTTVTQPDPDVDATTGAASFASWTENLTWDVPDDQASGLHYVIFRTASGHESTTHFVVREATVTGRVAVVIPDLTHHAYNYQGDTSDNRTDGFTGRSLYQAGTDGGTANFAHRAYAVSFDRPYATPDTVGQTYIFDSSYGWLQFAEAQGLPLSYLSDMDVDADTDLLSDAALVVLLGHHEYWTTNVYDAVLNAQDAGVNMMIYSANTAGWHVRLDEDDPRTVICYKDDGTRDGTAGFTGTGFNPDSVWTGAWRDPTAAGGIDNDDVRLDISLTGTRFVASGPLVSNAIVYDASDLPMVRNSPGLAAGKTDGAANLGYELDSADGSTGQPSNLVTLYSTDLAVTTGANAAGTVYSTSTTVTGTQVLWRHTSGALIWKSAGWRDWWSASRFRGGSPVSTVDVDIQNYLLAMLYDLGATPAGLHALRPGEDDDLTDPSTGAPTGGRNAVATAYGLTVPTAGGTGAGFLALLLP